MWQGAPLVLSAHTSLVVLILWASSLARVPPLDPALLGIREDVCSGVVTDWHKIGFK